MKKMNFFEFLFTMKKGNFLTSFQFFISGIGSGWVETFVHSMFQK